MPVRPGPGFSQGICHGELIMQSLIQTVFPSNLNHSCDIIRQDETVNIVTVGAAAPTLYRPTDIYNNDMINR